MKSTASEPGLNDITALNNRHLIIKLMKGLFYHDKFTLQTLIRFYFISVDYFNTRVFSIHGNLQRIQFLPAKGGRCVKELIMNGQNFKLAIKKGRAMWNICSFKNVVSRLFSYPREANVAR